ncbi:MULTISPECIES: AAA family ATPase [Exiguobacterium]|uniref:AAA family ATPase n=1 Tax=Exiguobacterium TaxID=33986 RepID=UPI001BE65E7A|nr:MULTISPECIES: AAA family ATPase [Exiguobacterium]MCT4776474.1 ATP-binding protein [Exiguobacterium aquaticum]MCT4788294.1 ATP-binding protein [Exiguobacterium mexicanum]
MKIVYLWCDMEAKNNQVSFNLGSNHIFSYDIQSSHLSYAENFNYINNFFSSNIQKNIVEVNALVGANGVGKTTVLNRIRDLLSGYNTGKYVLIVTDDEKYTVYSNVKVKVDNNELFNFNNKIPGEMFRTIFFSNTIDTGYFRKQSSHHSKSKHINISTNQLIKKHNNIDQFYIEDLQDQILFVDKFKGSDLSKFFNIPNNIYLYLQTIESEFESKFFSIEAEEILVMLINLNMDSALLLNNSRSDQELNFLRRFLKNGTYYLYTEIDNILNKNLGPLKKEIQLFLEGICKNMYNIEVEKSKIESKQLNILNQFLYLKNEILNILYNKKWPLNLLEEDFKILEKEIHILDRFILTEGLLFNFLYERTTINFDLLNADMKGFLIKWREKKLGGLIWTELSSGEYGILNMFSRIYSASKLLSKDSKQKLNLLLLDEGELYFHPQWQKHFIKILIKGIEEIFSQDNVPVQIIVSTHSPFIISDLPNDRVLFLKKIEGSIQSTNSLEDNHLTFGANIHQLYSNVFFLQDGLIGEFAKDKINSLIHNLLNSHPTDTLKNADTIRKSIHMIAEPLIKNKLIDIYEEQLKLIPPSRIDIETELLNLKLKIHNLEKILEKGEKNDTY